MIRGTVIIQSELGLHLRPASELCKLAMTFTSEIILKSENKQINAKSVLGLLAAQMKQGDSIEIICSGKDEDKAYEALMEALTKDYRQYQ